MLVVSLSRLLLLLLLLPPLDPRPEDSHFRCEDDEEELLRSGDRSRRSRLSRSRYDEDDWRLSRLLLYLLLLVLLE